METFELLPHLILCVLFMHWSSFVADAKLQAQHEPTTLHCLRALVECIPLTAPKSVRLCHVEKLYPIFSAYCASSRFWTLIIWDYP